MKKKALKGEKRTTFLSTIFKTKEDITGEEGEGGEEWWIL